MNFRVKNLYYILILACCTLCMIWENIKHFVSGEFDRSLGLKRCCLFACYKSIYIFFFSNFAKTGEKKTDWIFTSSWRIKRWNVNLTLYLIGPFHFSELNAFSITLNNISGHWKPISHLWSKETRHIHWNRRFKKAYFISDVDSQGSPGQSFRVIVYSLRDETVLFSSDLRVISNFPSQYPWYQAVFKSQINLKNANSWRSSGAEIKRIKQNISVLWL